LGVAHWEGLQTELLDPALLAHNANVRAPRDSGHGRCGLGHPRSNNVVAACSLHAAACSGLGAKVFEVGLEPTISSLGGRRLIGVCYGNPQLCAVGASAAVQGAPRTHFHGQAHKCIHVRTARKDEPGTGGLRSGSARSSRTTQHVTAKQH
jgi:hypothetical protein